MEFEEASKILGEAIEKNGNLYSANPYIIWGITGDQVTLDGEFTAQELEAIAYWMRHKKIEKNDD